MKKNYSTIEELENLLTISCLHYIIMVMYQFIVQDRYRALSWAKWR